MFNGEFKTTVYFVTGSSHSGKSLFSETYPKEYSLAEDIYSVFEKSYGIKENIRETDFLASYFVAINQLSEKRINI